MNNKGDSYMNGKILKVSSNDVYGKVDERVTRVYACFEHVKYMNNYVIFSFDGENDKNKLCYGSIHLKSNSVVIFSVKDDIKQYIDEFLYEYENSKIENFKIIDISHLDRVEIVSYNEMDYDKLDFLDSISIAKEIKKEVVVVKEKEKQPIFLYFLLVILILFAVFLTLLYFNPKLFSIQNKKLLCTDNLYDKEMELFYDIEKDVKFNSSNKVDSIDVVIYYTFLNSDSYYEFKNNNKHTEFLNKGEGYKYVDDALQFRVIYQEKSVIDDYEEMFIYLKREGFSCKEVEYEE